MILTIATLIFTVIPYQPPRSIYNEDWNGASKFRESIETLPYINITTSRILVSPIILDSRSDVDIVIIIGSERRYSSSEVSAYQKFVERGGNLIIFEDTGQALEIVKRFNIDFFNGILKERHPSRFLNRPSQILFQDVLIQLNFKTTISPLIGSDLVGVVDWKGLTDGTTIPLLVSFNTAFADSNDNNILDEDDLATPFGLPIGLFKPWGKNNGTVTVIGGSSIPLNQYWDKVVSVYNYATDVWATFKTANSFWLPLLIGVIGNLTGSSNVLFDESHQQIVLTSAAGVFNLIAGTWVAMINTAIISIFTIAFSFILASARLRSKVKRAVKHKLNPNVSVNHEADYISHPTFAERMISEEFIMYQVMGDGFVHVANTSLINNIKQSGKGDAFLKELMKEYGALNEPKALDVLVEMHDKMRVFVEENKDKWL